MCECLQDVSLVVAHILIASEFCVCVICMSHMPRAFHKWFNNFMVDLIVGYPFIHVWVFGLDEY
jgi:ABC-type amino acid transport system permease subunit